MIPDVETKRLWLRALELWDAAQVQPLFARWEVVEFLNDKVPWPFPEDGVEAYYREVAIPAIDARRRVALDAASEGASGDDYPAPSG